MASTYQGFKGSSINHTHPQAEREVTLTEIDSWYQNGNIDKKEARDLTVKWALDTNHVYLLPSILG